MDWNSTLWTVLVYKNWWNDLNLNYNASYETTLGVQSSEMVEVLYESEFWDCCNCKNQTVKVEIY